MTRRDAGAVVGVHLARATPGRSRARRPAAGRRCGRARRTTRPGRRRASHSQRAQPRDLLGLGELRLVGRQPRLGLVALGHVEHLADVVAAARRARRGHERRVQQATSTGRPSSRSSSTSALRGRAGDAGERLAAQDRTAVGGRTASRLDGGARAARTRRGRASRSQRGVHPQEAPAAIPTSAIPSGASAKASAQAVELAVLAVRDVAGDQRRQQARLRVEPPRGPRPSARTRRGA